MRWLLQTVSTNMDSLSTSFDNLYFPAITVCNINFMQRSVLEKYNLQNNETLIDIFDRMMNKGSDKPFTPDELEVTIENTIFRECPLSQFNISLAGFKSHRKLDRSRDAGFEA